MEPTNNTTANPVAKKTFQLEDLYLKIFKYTMIMVMTVALLAVLVLLPMATVSYFQTPAAVPPVQAAPVKEINIEDLKNILINEKKKAVIKDEQAKSRAAGKEPTNTVPAAEVIFDKPYDSLVSTMYSCVGEYATAINANVLNIDVTQQREQLRFDIEKSANQPNKGADWVAAVVKFGCQILKDPAVHQLAKDNKIATVLYPLITFHGRAWVSIQNEKLAFEQNQQRQFNLATAAEVARVAAAKSASIIMASVAGSAFLLFIVLALYLIFAKIENNLGLIHRSIEAVRPHNNNI